MSLQAELPVLLKEIGTMTVDRLKLALRNISSGTLKFTYVVKLSGLKGDLFSRLREILLDIVEQGHEVDLAEYSRCIYAARDGHAPVLSSPSHAALAAAQVQARQNAIASGSRYAYGDPHAASLAYQQSQALAAHEAQARQQQQLAYARNYAASMGYNGGASRAYPHPPSNDTTGAPAAGVDTVPIRFHTSPFYRVEKALSGIINCIRAGQGDKKLVFASFALTESQRALLLASKESPSNPQYQVRLFSTSESLYNVARPVMSQAPAYMEFPEVCEIKLNNYPVPSNTKGVKKKLGSAPPVDLGKASGANGQRALLLTPGSLNRAEIVYMKTEKKYTMVIYLVQVTSIKSVLDTIKKAKYRSKEQTIADIIKINSDEDVIATAYGLSLNDPLTFARIKTPVRSIACSHVACFDAEVFFMMNEQTPTWNCPICSKVLRVEDIAVDGFFDNILSTVSSSVDSVTIEPDGTWRSSDNKHGTAVGVGSNSNNGNSNGDSNANGDSAAMSHESRSGSANGAANDKGKGRVDQNSLTLDSDDDSPMILRIKQYPLSIGSSPTPPTSFRTNGHSNGNGNGRRSEVIDLTLSSDEEDEDDECNRPLATGISARAAPTPPNAGRSPEEMTPALQARLDLALLEARQLLLPQKRAREDSPSAASFSDDARTTSRAAELMYTRQLQANAGGSSSPPMS